MSKLLHNTDFTLNKQTDQNWKRPSWKDQECNPRLQYFGPLINVEDIKKPLW